ncbi:MAG: hypothetical protein ACRDA8_10215, partial [Shewanella sp.]
MKINKSKEHLAAKIKSSGFEWPRFGRWATQDKDGEVFISGGDFIPVRLGGEVNWEFGEPYKSAGMAEVGVNWFQCILSRAEYFHLYPAPDADGWIEWEGGECPVGGGVVVDLKWSDGFEPKAAKPEVFRWQHLDSHANIIAYRLHKSEQAKSSAVGDDETSLAKNEDGDMLARLADLNVAAYKRTIEELAADYRNKLDYANRKQDEADKANMESDAALSELEKAIAAIGFAITPIDV